MWILGLDTSTWTASIGIARDGEPVAARCLRAESSHALTLLPLIEETLAAAGIDVGELDAIAVANGPGSFTGLRVGLSTAKGLAYAVGARLVAVPSLEAMARAVGPRPTSVCPVLDARKGEVYAALFRWRAGGLERLGAEQTLSPRALVDAIDAPCTFVGEGVDVYGDLLCEVLGERALLLPSSALPPLGGTVARMGWERLQAGEEAPLAALEPLYVRPSEAECKWG